ncbi:hypothetical protein L9F63_010675, partial [Diploptera punctata]
VFYVPIYLSVSVDIHFPTKRNLSFLFLSVSYLAMLCSSKYRFLVQVALQIFSPSGRNRFQSMHYVKNIYIYIYIYGISTIILTDVELINDSL